MSRFNLRIVPLSWNALTAGAITTDVLQFMRTAPPSNILDLDMRKLAIGTGVFVVDSSNNKIDIDTGGGEVTATLNSDTYANPQDVAIEAQRALNAVSSSWVVTWRQIPGAMYTAYLTTGSSTTLKLSSGTNASVNFLVTDFGFAPVDETGTLHLGTAPVIHGKEGEFIQWDLTSATPIECAVLINPKGGSNLVPEVRFGTTTAVSDATKGLGEMADVMVNYFETLDGEGNPTPDPQSYRYVQLNLIGPHTDETAQVGAGYFYLGPYFEASRNWEWQSFSLEPTIRSAVTRGIHGHPFVSEVQPTERFSVEWTSRPGLDPNDLPAFEELFATLGQHDLVVISVDPETEPTRHSQLCRVSSPPAPARRMTQGPGGRWSFRLDLETVTI